MKVKKFVLFFLIVFFSVSILILPCYAENYPEVNVLVNNNTVEWGVKPISINGEVFVPLEEISLALQIESEFDIKTLTAEIKMEENQIEVKLDNDIASLNGKYIKLTGPLKIIKNRIMVPVKMFKHLGMFITERDGTVLIFKPENKQIIYKVVSGDFLWKIGQMFGESFTYIKTLNNLNSNMIYLGQKLIVKTVETFKTNFDAVTDNATIESGPAFWYKDAGYLKAGTYVKVTGKNGLWYKVSTSKGNGYIYYTVIDVVQDINDTNPKSTYFEKEILVDTSGDSSYITYYTVISGDTLWDISEKKGLPVQELMSVNGLTWSSYLKIGQVLKIPVHNIESKQTLEPNYAEVLDWFTEGQYVFPITKAGKLIDVETGLSFNVKRTMGASHSDTETLTSKDTQIMKQIFGGSWTWTRRAFILEVDGRRFAVSVSGMPHAGVDGEPYLKYVYNRSGDYGYGQNLDRILGNQMNGHFDLYFLNGRRHMDNQIDPDHQKMILTAGGLR